MTGKLVFFDHPSNQWLHFSSPRRIIEVHHLADVRKGLEEAETAVRETGCHAAGFVSYDAAPAFESACTALPSPGLPLLWFGLYDPPLRADLPLPQTAPENLSWRPALSEERFCALVRTIKDHIARGETYQVNLTFPLHFDLTGSPWDFFLHLVHGQQARYAAFADIGPFAICSASPELFFDLDGRTVTVRPMKGTALRGRTTEEDRRMAEELSRSTKDRAENVMILDMIRSDLGRLGPVRTPDLFRIEKYPTVWQMTSSAVTETAAPVSDIFSALFPCASITGAPRYKTMEIIAALEKGPRNVYTGAMGWIAPDRRARFNVAIRTAVVDKRNQRGEYRVGAGITWSSDPADEYRECLAKARILDRPVPDFSLLESIRWTPDEGFWLQEEHLRRMKDSADYFDVPFSEVDVDRHLRQAVAGLDPIAHKIRLLLDVRGKVTVEAAPLIGDSGQPVHLKLAQQPIDPGDPFLYHKTTHRQAYRRAGTINGIGEDIVLFNGQNEVTETTIANLVVENGGIMKTPPVRCGLLPGTLRTHLLRRGKIQEGVITLDELRRADRIWLINSVRGWRRGILR